MLKVHPAEKIGGEGEIPPIPPHWRDICLCHNVNIIIMRGNTGRKQLSSRWLCGSEGCILFPESSVGAHMVHHAREHPRQRAPVCIDAAHQNAHHTVSTSHQLPTQHRLEDGIEERPLVGGEG